MDGVRQRLLELETALEEAGEGQFAKCVRETLYGSDGEVAAFVVSNTLWGGSGSIADHAGFDCHGFRTDARRRIERTLAALGEEQARAGVLSPRTMFYVVAFRQWESDGR